MDTYDLAVNNGLVINSTHKEKASLGVRDGKIVAVSQEPLTARNVIDAGGKWVIPGVVDTHIHFALKQGQGDSAVMTEDDYTTGPIASAVGGVTTFVDYAICPQDRKLRPFLDERIAMADKGSCIDYGFHSGITNSSQETLKEIKGVVDMGIPSFKFFMTYRKWGFAVGMGFLLEVFKLLKEYNGVACIHCEQDEIIEFLREKYKGETSMEYFGLSRPDFSEEISIAELAILARETGSRLHVVHLSTEKGLNAIRNAKREGIRVRTETCPHYLYYSDEVFKRKDGYLYTMTPPLRPKGNAEALWQGLLDGSIQILTSDHNALGKNIKLAHPGWLDVPPGLGGSEMNLTFLHSEGVVKRGMTPEKMVDLLSSAPAEEFGVPGKGRLEVGFDADLVVFNPETVREVKFGEMATPGGFTIYEGAKMQGWPDMTISRGEVIVKERKFIGKTGRGRFIKRSIDPSK
jgi:dihydropyrimidinase